MPAGRRSLFFILLPCVFLAGCRRHDLVENELRHKETLLRETVAELKRCEAYNAALLHELQAYRTGSAPVPLELASSTFTLKRIVLGRGTGGHDNDNLPGDEALQVVVEPRDMEDHTIKVPGSLQITAIEIDPHGLKRPRAGRWLP